MGATGDLGEQKTKLKSAYVDKAPFEAVTLHECVDVPETVVVYVFVSRLTGDPLS